MIPHHRPLSGWMLVAISLIVPLSQGCGQILNDNLFSSFGGNAVTGLPRPNGAIIILVMNQTTSAAVVRVQVNKTPYVADDDTTDDGTTGGGTTDDDTTTSPNSLELSIPLDPYGPATELDHAMIVQECDVTSIQFLGGSIQSDTGGDPVEIPADLPPITYGSQLYCGDVVAITIVGVGLQPVISIY